MEISSIVMGVVLFGVSVAYVVSPFRRKQQKPGSATRCSDQNTGKREATLSALRDLDFDFKTGKVAEDDYQPLRAQLLAEAALYIEAEKKGEEQLEQMILSRRKITDQKNTCPHCQSPVRADQRFCSRCGNELSKELCPSCGKHLRSGDLFCSSCGNPIQMPVKAAAS